MAGRVDDEDGDGGGCALKAGYDDALGSREGAAEEACEAAGDGHRGTQRDGTGCGDELAHRGAKIKARLVMRGLKRKESFQLSTAPKK